MTRDREMPPSLVTEDLVRKMAVDATTYARGRKYQTNGMVMRPKRIENGVEARVIGNSRPFYVTRVTLTWTGELEGECTCPAGMNCKHCVAVGLEWFIRPGRFTKPGQKIFVASEVKVPKLEGTGVDLSFPQVTEFWTLEDFQSNFYKLWNLLAPGRDPV